MNLPDNTERRESSRIMCSIAFEHAESIKILIATGNFTSAIGLLRLQYESLTRAIWLFYAATDTVVSKLMDELTHESSKRSDRLPMLSEMLKNIEGKARNIVLAQLLEFKEYSWKPLSSFIHGGIHALNRHSKGYPVPLLTQTITASNGLSVMVGMILIVLANDIRRIESFLKIHKEFSDCLPKLNFDHCKFMPKKK